jgi:hypothetical protein
MPALALSDTRGNEYRIIYKIVNNPFWHYLSREDCVSSEAMLRLRAT